MEWIQLATMIVSGGAMGSIITAVVTNRRNRVPTIGIYQSISRVFTRDQLAQARIFVSTTEGDFSYTNLYIAEIAILNSGNVDYSEFNLKMSLSKLSKFINVEFVGQDNSHEVLLSPQITFSSPSKEINVIFNPFNRRNFYYLTIYVSCEDDDEFNKTDVSYSSKTSVRFKSIDMRPSL